MFVNSRLKYCFLAILLLIIPLSEAHSSGCHRWHSCPSDTGSYVCGDLGYPCIYSSETPQETGPVPAPNSNIQANVENSSSDVVNQVVSEVINQLDCSGTFYGKIDRIVDGDTLKVVGCSQPVRLSLVDTPEDYEPGYEEAKSFTSSLCVLGQEVTINQDSRQPYDKYGRIVALVYCKGKKLNAELLYSDLADIDKRFCNTSEFVNESWAQDYGCGKKKEAGITANISNNSITGNAAKEIDIKYPPKSQDSLVRESPMTFIERILLFIRTGKLNS